MTLAQLRAFFWAASFGTFTAAARELETTQPTVSELVRKLEEAHGLPLFVRAGRRLTLTPAGTELLPWAQRVVEGVTGATEVLNALRGLERGVVSFGVLRNAPFYLLSNLVADFHRLRPGVRVRVIGQNSHEVAEAVRVGELEAGLAVLPVPDDGLSVKPLIRDEVLWVSSHPERVTAPMTMDRAADAETILYDAHYGWNDPTRRQLSDRAQAAGVRLDPLIEVENVDSALDLVKRGMGETIASRSVVRHSSFPAGLHTTPFADPFYETIALIKRRDSTLSPGTAELAQLAVAMLLAVPWALRPAS